MEQSHFHGRGQLAFVDRIERHEKYIELLIWQQLTPLKHLRVI